MKIVTTGTKCRGAILIEVLVAGSLLALVTGGGVMMAGITRDAYRSEAVSAEIDELAALCIDEIAERLRPADLANVNPAAFTGAHTPVAFTGARTDVLSFQAVTLPGAAASVPESIVLEEDPEDADDGIDNDGDGLIDERYVVWYEDPGGAGERRHVLTKWVTEDLEGEIPGNNMDDNGNGLIDEAGLTFEFQEGRIVIHLSLEKPDRNGFPIRRTLVRSVALRNTDN